jgi:hypothetical protein
MDDLVYTATITLADALCARPLTLETLDGQTQSYFSSCSSVFI